MFCDFQLTNRTDQPGFAYKNIPLLGKDLKCSEKTEGDILEVCLNFRLKDARIYALWNRTCPLEVCLSLPKMSVSKILNFVFKAKKDLCPPYRASPAETSRTAEILTQVALTGFGLQGHVKVSEHIVTCQRSDVSFVVL